MKLTDNKALNILIVVNVLALIAIFILLWILWKNDTAVPVENTIQKSTAETVIHVDDDKNTSADVEEELKRKMSMSEKIRLEVDSIEKSLEREIDKEKESVTDTLANVKDLSELSDIEYVLQYEKTKNEVQPARKISREDVTTVKVVQSASDSNVQKFNNIDVSGLKNRSEMLDSITSRISSLMSTEKESEEVDTVKPEAWNEYLDSIKSAEVERKNEMRTIRVKAGESLWQIAVRAYGSGFMYKKIFAANPQLTNPNLIVAGQKLRVPL